MTPAARLTLAGSGTFIAVGTVAVVLGLGYRHPVRTDDDPATPPSKLAQAIERAAPELLDPSAAWGVAAPVAPVIANDTVAAPPPPVDMPPEHVGTPPRTTARVHLKKAADVGYVRVTTQPWGWATAGGQRIETIGSGRLTLTPGRHTVTIHCAECTPHRTATRAVTIKPNMTEHLTISWDDERARERAALR